MTQGSPIVLITGGNAGIGKAIASRFLRSGASVVILGINTESGLETVAAFQQEFPSCQVVFITCDVSQTAAVDASVEEVLQKLGRIDVLVNNAGIVADQLLMKMQEDEWDRVLQVNLKSCYNLCRATVRSMLRNRSGRIINISSVIGLMGNSGQTNYAASKAGMIGFSKSLAKEVATRGITVNCVAPGFIETQMTAGLAETQKQAILQDIPMGYMGLPEDIAEAVYFFASPAARYITGQVLAVDGGMVMH